MVEIIISTKGYFQRKLKDGYCFICTTGPRSVGEGDIRFALFDTGSTPLAQILKVICSCDQQRRFRICENPTQTDKGTQQSARNMRIGHTRTPGSSLYYLPTITAEGSVWTDFWVNPAAPTVLDLIEAPWLLQSNQMLLITTAGGASQNASFSLQWEEE